jgi:glycosyltransferase involved in cell wall biosynthesis
VSAPAERPLRVLFVTTAYPAHAADPRGTFVHALARALARLGGVRVTVLAPGAPGAPASERRDGVEIRRAAYWTRRGQALAVGHHGIIPNLRRRPWLALQVPALVAALTRETVRLAADADLVHAHWVYPGGLAGLAARRRRGVPLVVTSHGTDLNLTVRSRALRWLARRVALGADACLGVSHAMVERFLALGVPAERVRYVPLGVEAGGPEGPAPARAGGGPFAVWYVGGLTRNKSVETLVRAHAELARRGRRATLTVVGSGPEEPALRALASELGLGDAVRFPGPKPPAEIPALLAGADALVLPSRTEGRGLVLLEAMAAGVPVVASDIPGPREIVLEGETGLRFPAGDASRLADALERLLSDEALRARLVRGGRALIAREGLTTAASAERHLEVYRAVLAGARRPA